MAYSEAAQLRSVNHLSPEHTVEPVQAKPNYNTDSKDHIAT